MKKTICFFSGDITRGGGTERVSTIIANALVDEGKYEILFVSLTEQAKNPFFHLDERISHYALGEKWIQPGIGYLKIIPQLRRFLKYHQVDLIIDIDIVLDVLSIPATRGLNTKVISWEHFNYEYELQSWYRKYILKYSVRYSDYIVLLTQEDKENYQAQTGRYKNMMTIYNPIQDISGYEEPKKENWIITIGHLIPRKGIDYLAQVAYQVLKKAPDWKWIVVGSGEEQTFLQHFIQKNQLEEQLILAGRTKNVYSLLAKSQIYVMTSRLEGLPMCLLEAKTFGLPSISFDILTGPKEIIEEGKSGYLISPFDCQDMAQKILDLIEDPSLRTCFSFHAQDNLNKFRLENIIKDWNKMLDFIFSAREDDEK